MKTQTIFLEGDWHAPICAAENPNAHMIEIFNLVQQDFIKQKTNEVMKTLGKPVMTFNFTHVNSYPICQIN